MARVWQAGRHAHDSRPSPDHHHHPRRAPEGCEAAARAARHELHHQLDEAEGHDDRVKQGPRVREVLPGPQAHQLEHHLRREDERENHVGNRQALLQPAHVHTRRALR
jgi:hypothetical protein